MDELKAIDEYPDVSFIENYTLSQLNADMIRWFKEKKKHVHIICIKDICL